MKSVDSLDAAFARAHHALASHHLLKSLHAWKEKEPVKTGHALRAAVRHVEDGFVSAREKVDSEAKRAIDAARDAAGSLVHGSGEIGVDVGKSIEDLGKQTEVLGQRIKAQN